MIWIEHGLVSDPAKSAGIMHRRKTVIYPRYGEAAGLASCRRRRNIQLFTNCAYEYDARLALPILIAPGGLAGLVIQPLLLYHPAPSHQVKAAMNGRLRISQIAWIGAAALLIINTSRVASAQELEPRAYSPAPVGVNFLGLSYLHSNGGIAVDPSLPLQNVSAEVNSAALSYAQTFGLFGRSASAGAVLPYSRADVSADLFEQQRAVTRSGFADPRFRLAVNLIGGPALDREEFAARTPSTTLGASLTIVAPFGKYDSNRLINVGSNRWAFKPEIGVYQPLGPWSLELYGGAWLYTDNDDFFGGARREQAPIVTLQSHIGYTFSPGLWLAADATYYAGGETTINGVHKADRQENTRVGLTLSLPIAEGHSLKLNWTEGVTARIGTSFTTLGVTWQYTWFN